MPLEVGWAATVRWMGGDVLCRVMAFFRVFGLFLSSNIIICISFNRFKLNSQKLISMFHSKISQILSKKEGLLEIYRHLVSDEPLMRY